jgi:hypothetical protein
LFFHFFADPSSAAASGLFLGRSGYGDTDSNLDGSSVSESHTIPFVIFMYLTLQESSKVIERVLNNILPIIIVLVV